MTASEEVALASASGTRKLSLETMALPLVSGQTPLTSPTVPIEVQRFLEQEDAFLRHEEPEQISRTFTAVSSWEEVAKEMISRKIIKGTDRSRVIVDRRSQNDRELSLRDVVLSAALEGSLQPARAEHLMRLMTLPYAAQFTKLLVSRSASLSITTEDAADYYYHLKLPMAAIRTNCVGPLLRSEVLEGGTEEHVAALQRAQSEFGPCECWSVCLVAPPMGDQKAPDIAQCVHTHLGWESGCLTPATCMSHGYKAPSGALVGCYVDDYAQVAALDQRMPSPYSADEVADQAEESHSRMLGAYRQAAIETKKAKATKDEKSATIWGASLDGSRRVVSANPQKRKLLVLATLAVCRENLVAPALVQILIGHWQHHLAFNRACMCVVDRTYAWLRSSYVGTKVARTRKWLTRQVRDELLGLCLLAPVMCQHLDIPVSEYLVATDATIKKGAVVLSRLTSPSQAAFLWLACDKPTSRMTFIPDVGSASGSTDKFILRLPPQSDEAVNSFIRTSQFHAASSYVFKTEAHINRQEMLAWLSGLRVLARHQLAKRRRVIVLLTPRSP
eukprot:772177-Amphidinium_carterae.3